MTAGPPVSLILCTFNRCDELRAALDALLAQPATLAFELLVVDNDSTDGTRQVVESAIPAWNGRLRYVFEPRQGLAYARNAGIAEARADLIAFTDDDVRVGPAWVASIVRTFRQRPDVDCLGGRTLPAWPSPPPAWLTPRHWVGPLALQDYGERPFVVDAQRPLCLAGANLGFRRQVFERIGLFSPDYPRSEDTELLLRFWLAGMRALYVPTMVAYAAVQPERLEKAYHRRWHTNIGRCNARMLFEERSAPDVGLRPELPDIARILGLPRFAIRQAGVEAFRWVRSALTGRPDETFWHEVRLRSLLAYIHESRTLHRNRVPVGARIGDDGAPERGDPRAAPSLSRTQP